MPYGKILRGIGYVIWTRYLGIFESSIDTSTVHSSCLPYKDTGSNCIDLGNKRIVL